MPFGAAGFVSPFGLPTLSIPGSVSVSLTENKLLDLRPLRLKTQENFCFLLQLRMESRKLTKLDVKAKQTRQDLQI